MWAFESESISFVCKWSQGMFHWQNGSLTIPVKPGLFRFDIYCINRFASIVKCHLPIHYCLYHFQCMEHRCQGFNLFLLAFRPSKHFSLSILRILHISSANTVFRLVDVMAVTQRTYNPDSIIPFRTDMLHKLRSAQNTGTCYPGQAWFVRNLG